MCDVYVYKNVVQSFGGQVQDAAAEAQQRVINNAGQIKCGPDLYADLDLCLNWSVWCSC